MPMVITANRLSDGLVVFLGDGGWVGALSGAAVLDPQQAETALARAKEDEARQIVVEPYAVEVVASAEALVPKTLRESIRANGPTVRPYLSASARTATD